MDYLGVSAVAAAALPLVVLGCALSARRTAAWKASLAGLLAALAAVSPDLRAQALLVAFAFGAFIEGASGVGTSVAVRAALLAGLGFPPLLAGGISLLANTAPVAYGALGLPIVTLSGVTEYPVPALSAAVGRISPVGYPVDCGCHTM